jgi:hypothetical protein
VVGSLRAPLDFRSLAGQTEYLQAVQQQYKELQASWLTPVEIFQPHYGRAIAAYILQRWQQQTVAAAAGGTLQQVQQEEQREEQLQPLRIFEIGGGTGTLARNILVRILPLLPLLLPVQLLPLLQFHVVAPMPVFACSGCCREHVRLPLCVTAAKTAAAATAPSTQDWLREEHPAAYQRCQYRCIEISPALAALQRQKVAVEGGHAGVFNVRRHDAADAAAWVAADAEEAASCGSRSCSSGDSGNSRSSSSGGSSQGHCFIVMCEVLDNLPHDR